MTTSVRVVLSSLFSRRLCTRPLHRVRQIPQSFLGTSSGDDSGPKDKNARPPVDRLSFAESLRKAKEDAESINVHEALDNTREWSSDSRDSNDSSSDSSSESSGDSSEDDGSLHSNRVSSKLASQPAGELNQFVTVESNPLSHTMEHEGMYYSVNTEDQEQFFPKFVNGHYNTQASVLGNIHFMIRKPALEIMDIMEKNNFNCPTPKFIIYGPRGSGKTSTLSHVMHYCGKKNHLLLNIPWAYKWIHKKVKSTPSISQPGYVNIPQEAQEWISHFATINAPLIKTMKVTKSIQWTKNEVTEAGSPLQSLIDFGILRQKYADDVVDVLLDEVLNCATKDEFKAVLLIDGLNAFYRSTYQREPLNRQNFIHAENLCLVNSFKRFLNTDNKNVVAVCTVSEEVNPMSDRERFTPIYLLGKKASQELEPYIPVQTENFSDMEAKNCLDMFANCKYLINPGATTPAGRRQIKFLTNYNPYALSKLCSVY